ncbi:di-heme oxidoreductase family protein [Tateyamaria omphalii]|uniref:Thiol oxidoreductase n=1 Tax=Tateyamaria omphalii TaxID=299262 RepID=A0A1P8N187_9RHOB|nr:di-heme oxidoredictase family protein [Tateyamaria omphalii]APX14087.1 thiol oxidoreductase [Tateyamaria omphalii]
MSKIATSAAFILPATLAFAAPAGAELTDLHLPVIPRTAAEAERIERVIAPTTDFTKPEQFESNPAGAATVRARTTRDAFSQPSGNISFEKELDFKVGNGLFKKLWVSSPASTLASDGLGPLFNARSCQRCHLKDGRGHPPEGPDDSAVSMLVRISIPGGATPEAIADYIATQPDPSYGGQIQDFSIAGVQAEADIQITYTEEVIQLSGGETASLRTPSYDLTNLGYGPLHPDAMISARVAPQMIGLGLLDAIPAADILAKADPDDADGDGISGRAQIVMSQQYGVPMLGRFGLKAGKPSVWEQSAAAFSGDIGISTTLHPAGHGDCTETQSTCRAAPNGNTAVHDDAEIGDVGLELVSFYSSNLAVPARRDTGDPQVLRGKQMFYETGCISCHTPKHVTHRLDGQPEQSFQLIWPYTDLLLHDMGPGLADNRPEARANGQEWRTPPLWGIGLTEQVSGHTYFLHDGRARNLLEAVLWHGGEAEPHKQSVIDMPPADRAALIRFLESL